MYNYYHYLLTQYRDDHVILDNLHRTVTDVIDVAEGVTPVDEVLPGGAEVSPDVEREQLQAALGRALEYRKLEDLPVQVHRDVPTQLLRELLQSLANDGIKNCV